MTTSPFFRVLETEESGQNHVSIFIDGKQIAANSNDNVAAVLLRQDSPISRTTPVNNTPRTPYCMMGVCFECLAIVNGVGSTQTCLTKVKEGMVVIRQHGRREISELVSSNERHDFAQKPETLRAKIND